MSNKKGAKMGAPTKFNDAQLKVIAMMCKLGATDQNLADALEVSIATINAWKHSFPDFLDTLKENKQIANSLVEQALFKRAMGSTVKEDKVFNNQGEIVVHEGVKEYPPDVAACVVWLSNRDPKRWHKDGQSESDNNNQPISKIQIEVVGANINNSTDSASS